MKAFAVMNNKGGVGKTTTAVSLAAELALRDLPTLLVDLDLQASASHWLGLETDTLGVSALAQKKGVARPESLKRIGLPYLEVLHADERLRETEAEIQESGKAFSRFVAAIQERTTDYAYTVIDCPPAFSTLTISALMASGTALLPLAPQYLALDGARRFFETLREMEERHGFRARTLGITLTLVDRRKRMTQNVIQMIRDHFGALVFQSEIPLNARIEEAPLSGRPVGVAFPHSPGALAYRALAEEVVARLMDADTIGSRNKMVKGFLQADLREELRSARL
jgi:chromosome partitioning protein